MEEKYISIGDVNIFCRYLAAPGKPKLMLVHGNVSSSAFYVPLMEKLEGRFEMLAPDLRCFGNSSAAPVDATRGMRDFSDDLFALTQKIGWNSFALLGWSMGGGVVMQYAIDHSDQLTGLILEGPLSPFGFGGTYGENGIKLEPAGLGSGGGCANAALVKALGEHDRAFAKETLDKVYKIPEYELPEGLEDFYIESILSTKAGEGMYPGNMTGSGKWPGIASGDAGICNTMSPKYCDLSGLSDIPHRMPVLWIRGDKDVMVSDNSLADFGTLGQLGIVDGWPGANKFPPQPMLAQTRYVLDKYRACGGSYKEVILSPSGHGCHIDQEEAFAEELISLLAV